MKRSTICRLGIAISSMTFTCIAAVAIRAEIPATYKGKPWQGKAQEIPGRVIAPNYDLGGEGVAYHDKEEKNMGYDLNSIKNEGTRDIDKFRMSEGVDISYTKKGIDKTMGSGAQEAVDVLYVGWTNPGEWINYTVDVKAAGTYTVNTHITADGPDRALSLDFNGADKSGTISISNTTAVHRWTIYKNLGEVKLDKGLQVMTLHIVNHGDMNIDYLEFVPKAVATAEQKK